MSQILAASLPGIKSNQSGSIDLNGVSSATATISSVDTTNCTLIFRGTTCTTAGISAAENIAPSLTLTNATTVTAQKANTGGSSAYPVYYTVKEWNPGLVRSVQRGAINTNGGTSATATISSVDMTKTVVTNLGHDIATSGAYELRYNQALTVTNATTITGTAGVNVGATANIRYEALEEAA